MWLAFLTAQKVDPAPQRLDLEGSLPGKPRGCVPSLGDRCRVLTGMPPAPGVRKHPAADDPWDSQTALPAPRAGTGKGAGNLEPLPRIKVRGRRGRVNPRPHPRDLG